MGYLTNAKGRGLLKLAQKAGFFDLSLNLALGNSEPLLGDSGFMNDYRVFTTNSASGAAGEDGDGNLLVFGNWSDLVIGQWGGYDVTVDPYSIAKDGQVRLVINSYFDAKGLRGSTSTGTGSDKDDYLNFASMAVRL